MDDADGRAPPVSDAAGSAVLTRMIRVRWRRRAVRSGEEQRPDLLLGGLLYFVGRMRLDARLSSGHRLMMMVTV
jgi:hypothetical protein